MAKQATEAPSTRGPRLTAAARKRSILAAARKAFVETGDMNGTTIRAIAEHGKISEGVIYRHFVSKEQLFLEAVVEPLEEAIDRLIAASETVDRDEPLTPARQAETLNGLYRQLTDTLEEMLPLLGLVLFGDPKIAQRFYNDSFAVAMDRLAESWRRVEKRYGADSPVSDVTARAVMGTSLVLALEHHHNRRYDRDRALEVVSQGTVSGYFPTLTAARKK